MAIYAQLPFQTCGPPLVPRSSDNCTLYYIKARLSTIGNGRVNNNDGDVNNTCYSCTTIK